MLRFLDVDKRPCFLQILAQIAEPEKVNRREILALDEEHDHAEDLKTLQTSRGEPHVSLFSPGFRQGLDGLWFSSVSPVPLKPEIP